MEIDAKHIQWLKYVADKLKYGDTYERNEMYGAVEYAIDLINVLKNTMSLDEAIHYTDECAESCVNMEYARDCRQLSAWLKELKEYREKAKSREGIKFIKVAADLDCCGNLRYKIIFSDGGKMYETYFRNLDALSAHLYANFIKEACKDGTSNLDYCNLRSDQDCAEHDSALAECYSLQGSSENERIIRSEE